ncbi:transposase, partial [Haloferula chungangensis]
DDWPGGLDEQEYSTLNLLAQCRQGTLGFNQVSCQDCHHKEWYASSCGNRHCPNCLGPRQAEWSSKLCERLPDCPHFHVVFTVPEEIHEFFELNYRIAADILFAAAAEILKLFQKNNWKFESGFLAVLHTWGSALNWHPHLHVLVSSGGRDCSTGKWRQARPNYLFPVRNMSKVFRAVFLRRLEALEASREVRWPEALDTLEARRDWRVRLAGRNWNIFSRATLGNTRAVVRYLARYTSRIAMSNQRIKSIDEQERTITFETKDYKNDGRKRDVTLSGKAFIQRFSRHLVPKRYRRLRSFGLLVGARHRYREIEGAPQTSINEKAPRSLDRACPNCESKQLRSRRLGNRAGFELPALAILLQLAIGEKLASYSLGPPDSG